MRRAALFAALLFLALPALAGAQTFASGSTGADGPLAPSMNPPDNKGGCVPFDYNGCWLQVPESGVFNFTTIEPGPFTIRFKPNSRNTPVYLLATGDIRLNAPLDLAGVGIEPGAGGYYGGDARFRTGFGPGGGTEASPSGRWVGPISLVPITGGSGGYAVTDGDIFAGGGGGGAIVIASSTQVVINSIVTVAGGGGAHGNNHGSGGAIRVVSNSITVGPTGVLNALGGNGGNGSNPGLIRLEAPALSNVFSGTATPLQQQADINPVVLPVITTPSLTIASFGGYTVGASRYGGYNRTAADLVVPAALQDPIALVVNGKNIPAGSTVTVVGTGSAITSTGGVLAGTLDASTATIQISGLDRTALTHLYLSTTFDVPPAQGGGANPPGPDQVARVRLESELGGSSRFTFLRKDGSVVPNERLQPAFLAHFAR
jgi:hypothetical protein